MAYSLEPLPAAEVDPNQVELPMLDFTSEEQQQLKTLPPPLQLKVALMTEQLSERLQHVRYLEDQLEWATEKVMDLSPQVHELEAETLRLTQDNSSLSRQIAAAEEREALLLAQLEHPGRQNHVPAEVPPLHSEEAAGIPASPDASLPIPSPAPSQSQAPRPRHNQAATRAVPASTTHNTEPSAMKTPSFSLARAGSHARDLSMVRSPVVPLPEGIRQLLTPQAPHQPRLRLAPPVARLLQSGRDDLSMLQTPAADREGVRTPLSSAGPMSPSLRQVTVGKLVQRIERLQQQLHFTARGGEGGAEEDAAAASPPPSTSPADQAGAHWELDSKLPRGCPEELENDNSNGLRASFGAWGEARGGWHQNPLYTPAPARAEQQAATGNDVARVDSSAELSAVTSTDGVAGSSERLDGVHAAPPAAALSCVSPDSARLAGQEVNLGSEVHVMQDKESMLMTAPEPHQPATDAWDFTFEAAERVANLTSKPVSGSMDRDDTELGRQSQITGDPAARGAALEETGVTTNAVLQTPGGRVLSYMDARQDQLSKQSKVLARLAASLQLERETLEVSQPDARRPPDTRPPLHAGDETMSLEDLERLAELQEDKASMLTEALRATQAKMGALELENKALRDLAGSAGLHVDGQGGRQGVASIELVEMTALMTSVNQHLPCIQADHQNQLASSHSTVQDLQRRLVHAEEELTRARHSLQEARGAIAGLEESASKEALCTSVATETDSTLCAVVCAGVQTETSAYEPDPRLPTEMKTAQPNPEIYPKTVLFTCRDTQTEPLASERSWEHKQAHGHEGEELARGIARDVTTDIVLDVESALSQRHLASPTRESGVQTEQAGARSSGASWKETVGGSLSSQCAQTDHPAGLHAGGTDAPQLARVHGSALQRDGGVELFEACGAPGGSGLGAGEDRPADLRSAATQTPEPGCDSATGKSNNAEAEVGALVSSLKERLAAAQTAGEEKDLALAEVQQQMVEMEEDAERLRRETSSLHAQALVHHQQTLDQEAGEAALKQQLEATNGAVAGLEGQLLRARREIAGYEATVQSFQEAQDEKDGTVQGYHATLETLQADLAAANHTVESLEQKLKGQAAELAEETANHEARHTLLEEQVLELQRDIKVKISELTSASTEIESLQQRCLALQEDVGSMTNMRDAAETELEGVRQQLLAESELRTADNQEALSRAQEARRGMEAAEAGKEAALASAHEEALRVQESLRDAEARVQASARLEQDLRHQLKQQNVEMEASNNKMSSLASDLASARAFGEEMARAVDSLRAHVHAISTAHEADVVAAKESHEEEMRTATEDHQSELYRLHTMHEADIAKSQKEHAQALDALRQEAVGAAQHHQQVLSQHAQRLSQLESEKFAADEEHKAELKVVEEKHQKEMDDVQSTSRSIQENWRATLAAEDSRQQQLLHQQQQQQQQVQLHQQQQQQQALQKAEAEHQAEVRRLKKRLSKERAHAASQLEVRAQKTLQEHTQQMDGLRLQLEVSTQQARAAEEQIQHVTLDLAQAQSQLVAARAEGTEIAAKLKFAKEELAELMSEREKRSLDKVEHDERASAEFQQRLQEAQSAAATLQAEGTELRDKLGALEKNLARDSRQHGQKVSQLEARVTEQAHRLKEAEVQSLATDDELAATRAALVESQRKLEACSVHVTDLQLRLSGAESRVAKRDVEADRFVQDGKQTMWILNKQLETLGESLAKKEEDLSRQAHHLAEREAVVKSSERQLAHALSEPDHSHDAYKARATAWECQLDKQCLSSRARLQDDSTKLEPNLQESLRTQLEAEMEDLRRAHSKQLAQVTLRCRQLEGELKRRSRMIEENNRNEGRFFLGEMADVNESASKTIDELRRENAEQNTALRSATSMVKTLQADQHMLERRLRDMSAAKRLLDHEVIAGGRINNISTSLLMNTSFTRQFPGESNMHESALGVRDTASNVQDEHLAMVGPVCHDQSKTYPSNSAERSRRLDSDPCVDDILAALGIRTQ